MIAPRGPAGPTGNGISTVVAPPRIDLAVVAGLVSPGARVLDLGCGDGTLLKFLVDQKGVFARGVEISDEGVLQCVSRGLAVDHADLDQGLGDYPDGSFDYVILSQTLQTVRKPDLVLKEMLRVGRTGIVSFPNFGYWRVRAALFVAGRMPKTDYLPYEWYDTPNIHLLTVKDFHVHCAEERIRIRRALYLGANGPVTLLANLRAKTAIFEVHKA
jgi:methionine biosynthesis protein MetW